MATISLTSVSKRFGSVTAVNDVTLECRDREFVVLLGSSGCGKTTLLRMIAGLESVTSGWIAIDDRVVNDVPPSERGIAMVFQNYALYPHMRVVDNMTLGLRRRRTARAVIAERLEEAGRLLRIGHLGARFPRELSGGQQQRVAVGRAIVREPSVLLMDEPLSNLDARLRMETRTELIKLHRRIEATIVLVTHDQVEAMSLADRIAIMRDGVLQQFDEPLVVYNRPVNRFVAGFMGATEMNFLEGRLSDAGGRRRLTSGPHELELPDRMAEAAGRSSGPEVVLGIRPEHLFPSQEGEIEVLIDTFEPLGSRALVLALAGDHSLVVEVPSEPALAAGTWIRLAIDWQRAHLFDARTELSLSS